MKIKTSKRPSKRKRLGFMTLLQERANDQAIAMRQDRQIAETKLRVERREQLKKTA